MKDINCYRGESRDYGETACRSGYERSGLSDKNVNNRDLLPAVENEKNFPFVVAVFSKKKGKNKNEGNLVKKYCILQHYGFATCLLDVTTNKDVAIYFACCSDFDKEGYVYVFEKKREIKSHDAKIIVKKVNRFLNPDDKIRLDEGEMKVSYTQEIIFNCANVYKSFHNARVENQQSYFYVRGIDIDNPEKLPDQVYNTKEKMESCEKIGKLIELAKKGINYLFLFPDSSEAIKILEYRQTIIKIEETDKREYIEKIVNERYKNMKDEDREKIVEILLTTSKDDLINYLSLFFVELKNYIEFLQSSKKDRAREYKSLDDVFEAIRK